MQKFEIVFFDCDGVLIFDEPYKRLNKAAGISEEMDMKWFNAYYDGQISFKEWLDRVDAYYQQHITENIFKKTLEDLVFNKEAFEIMKYLKTLEIKTAIVSSGIDEYVKRVAEELRIDYWRSNSHLVFDGKGSFVRTEYGEEDPVAKVRHIKEVCDTLGVEPVNTMFIGDSANDLKAFDYTKHGVLYRTNNKDYAKYAWKKINNLNEIKNFF